MKDSGAYFTVEAALVLPVVISVILFVIYTMLFQYDRCLLEQDLGAIALWGSLVDAPDTAALEQKIRERVSGLYRDKYMVWDITALDISLSRDRFAVTGAGRLTFPAPGWNFWSRENTWSTEADYGYSRLSPVTFIRLCRKFDKDTER